MGEVKLGAIVKYYTVSFEENGKKIEGVIEDNYDVNSDSRDMDVVDILVDGKSVEMTGDLVDKVYQVFNKEAKEV